MLPTAGAISGYTRNTPPKPQIGFSGGRTRVRPYIGSQMNNIDSINGYLKWFIKILEHAASIEEAATFRSVPIGELNLTSKRVELNSGFSVKKGGVLTIKNSME